MSLDASLLIIVCSSLCRNDKELSPVNPKRVIIKLPCVVRQKKHQREFICFWLLASSLKQTLRYGLSDFSHELELNYGGHLSYVPYAAD